MKIEIKIKGIVSSRLWLVKFIKEISGNGLKESKELLDEHFIYTGTDSSETQYGELILTVQNSEKENIKTLINDVLEKNPKLKITINNDRTKKLFRIILTKEAVIKILESYIKDMRISFEKMSFETKVDKILKQYILEVINKHEDILNNVKNDIYSIKEQSEEIDIISNCSVITIDKKIFFEYLNN